MSKPRITKGLCGRPTVRHCYQSTPSWKKSGKGSASIEFTRNKMCGTVSIRAAEVPEGGRGGKEVFIVLPKEYADALLRLLQGGEVEA